MATKRTDCICLFDVDGTLSEPRKQANAETLEFLARLRGDAVLIGVVGGSDLKKQQEQLGEDCLERFDYFFSENGLAAYKQGQLIKKTSFLDHLGNEEDQGAHQLYSQVCGGPRHPSQAWHLRRVPQRDAERVAHRAQLFAG